jgi:hypothetical protein
MKPFNLSNGFRNLCIAGFVPAMAALPAQAAITAADITAISTDAMAGTEGKLQTIAAVTIGLVIFVAAVAFVLSMIKRK